MPCIGPGIAESSGGGAAARRVASHRGCTSSRAPVSCRV